MVDKKKQGKRNRRKGMQFELLVRKDLESKGWIVSKWQNNVELEIQTKSPDIEIEEKEKESIVKITEYSRVVGKLIPSKRKFNPFSKALSLGTGFPDFIAYRWVWNLNFSELMMAVSKNGKIINESTTSTAIIGLEEYKEKFRVFEVVGIEAKSNGYLDKEEKEKCKWLLNNHIFARVLIAKKSKEKGEIIYAEYGNQKHT